MSGKIGVDEFHQDDVPKLDIKNLNGTNEPTADFPITVFVDYEHNKVTKCHTISNEPITVIMHDYGDSSKSTSNKTCTAGERKSLSFRVCNYFNKVSRCIVGMPSLVMKNSSTATELSSRNDELRSALEDGNEHCDCVRNSKCTVWLIQGFANILFGIILMALLVIYGHSISSKLLLLLDSGVRSMIALLHWLMGVPAGLKLNYKLTGFLGRFFMYHIWLWAEYLRMAGQYFDIIFITIACLGLPGGASLQLALLQDMLKIFLLHVYCFYVYSSRLYALTRYSLRSFWRLFRGLKWNLLRERVDHASYDSTQLFIGTLLFAILLFVLPTVFLYHLVFDVLKSIIQTLHLVVDRLRYFLAHSYTLLYCPVLSSIYNILYKEYDGLFVQSSSADNITILTMRHKEKPKCTNSTNGEYQQKTNM